MKQCAWAGLLPLGPIGWTFLKIGLVFFGGGFVLIPAIHREVVLNLHWLSEREFLDGVAISQLTPGPVAVLSTFCGFRLGGVMGALVATAAVFLPAFLLMLALSRGYERYGQMAVVRRALDALIPAVAGLLAAAAWQIGRQTVTGPAAGAILLASLLLLLRYRARPALLIGAAALLGWALRM